MKQFEKDTDSWLSLVWLGVCVYWGLYFLMGVLDLAPNYGLLYFTVGAIVFILLSKLGKKWLIKKWLGIFPEAQEAVPVKRPKGMLPFFVKGQLRRRKLDLTRKSNFITDNLGTKLKRQRQGIFGSKKKKRRR